MTDKKTQSPWRYLILVPYLLGIGVIVALLTGPVARLAVPVVVLLVLGAFVWDLIEARNKGGEASDEDRDEAGPLD